MAAVHIAPVHLFSKAPKDKDRKRDYDAYKAAYEKLNNTVYPSPSKEVIGFEDSQVATVNAIWAPMEALLKTYLIPPNTMVRFYLLNPNQTAHPSMGVLLPAKTAAQNGGKVWGEETMPASTRIPKYSIALPKSAVEREQVLNWFVKPIAADANARETFTKGDLIDQALASLAVNAVRGSSIEQILAEVVVLSEAKRKTIATACVFSAIGGRNMIKNTKQPSDLESAFLAAAANTCLLRNNNKEMNITAMNLVGHYLVACKIYPELNQVWENKFGSPNVWKMKTPNTFSMDVQLKMRWAATNSYNDMTAKMVVAAFEAAVPSMYDAAG